MNETRPATGSYNRDEAQRVAKANASASDDAAKIMQLHATHARNVCAFALLKHGQPMSAEAIAAAVEVHLPLVCTVLAGLVADGAVIRRGDAYLIVRTAT